MKALLYVLMCASIFYLSACGKKGSTTENNKIETTEHSHNHEHGEECTHEHNEPEEHSHEDECDGHDHNHDHEHSVVSESQAHEHGDNENIIMFTSEQARNLIEFEIETIKPQTFYQILKTSGQVLSAPGDESQIVATTSGILEIANLNLVEGLSVNSGQQLFRISGKNLSENNPLTRVSEAKSVYENAKTEYERALELIKDNIISQRDFQQIKLSYDQAKLNYETISAGMSGNSKAITSPMKGFVKSIVAQPGQYVETGQLLATVTQSKRLVLRADVSQRYLSQAKYVQTASFTTPYDNKTYELSDLNGRLMSVGRSTDNNTFYTPVSFEFDNKGNIIEGSFVEVYLKSQLVTDAIVVPISALIEEQGHFFVFVQCVHEGEYEKKEVRIGASDGINHQILGGLNVGEKVVTKGAFAVKLASMSGEVPHGHQH
ncbi:efflux RND transporter periplasmic adaptor subunit [Dysgonomonas sp. 216]|uniref:efflux RND transporter periplasmic adaptor subunit n=1 Tax=Dysgonomonas sp. 216 TaxID=2302934 RepID=UPI0013D59054|nr:efflux RND transporter periplasmic adaptor subunit [Dysgonomonas sp. 216]NDW17709.1 efflux RND transporter periplasmic adaptor subunit [Dysgonomonas sp. 216]